MLEVVMRRRPPEVIFRAKEGEVVGVLEVLVMWSEAEAAHHINKGGRRMQSLMMESLTH